MTDDFPRGRDALNGKTILLTTGGTGGHVFPAVATARALRAAGALPVFITNTLPKHLTDTFGDIPHYTIPAAPLSGSYMWLLKRFATLMMGTLRSFLLTRKIKPALAIGYGGYSMFGPLNAAMLLRVSYMLHEQNTVAGKANLHFLAEARGIALSFPETRFGKKNDVAAKKATVTGNPVRESFFNDFPRKETDDNGKTVIFVTGGSQAAAVFAYAVPTAIGLLPKEQRDTLKIVQQCRPEQSAGLENHYKRIGVEAELSPFFSDMPERLASCAFVIARAGASTLCEIAASGTPALLVPYPYAAGDHQRLNAEFFLQQDAARIAEETRKGGLTPETLLETIQEMLDPTVRETLSRNIKTLAMTDAAERIVDMAADILQQDAHHANEKAKRKAEKRARKKK